MKKIIWIILILISQNILSQSVMKKTSIELESNMFININVGIAIDNSELNFINNHQYSVNSIYGNNLTFIELAVTTTDYSSWDSTYFKKGGAITFKYFYPNTSKDSLGSRYSGNLFGFDLVGVNILPLTAIADIIVTGGVNMGSKKVRFDNVKYKNFVFAPRLTAEFRFRFSERWSITGRIEKQFDVSKPVWKLKSGVDILQLQEFKYSPLMFSAGIGWKL